MGYRRFTEKTTLSDARESAEYTVEALGAYPHKSVQALGSAIEAVLASLDALEGGRRRARRLTIRANAHVRTWDGVSDDLVRDLVKDVLGAVRQDRAAPLFTAFFPSQPSEIAAMSLSLEVEELARMLTVLAAKTTPPSSARHGPPVSPPPSRRAAPRSRSASRPSPPTPRPRPTSPAPSSASTGCAATPTARSPPSPPRTPAPPTSTTASSPRPRAPAARRSPPRPLAATRRSPRSASAARPRPSLIPPHRRQPTIARRARRFQPYRFYRSRTGCSPPRRWGSGVGPHPRQ